MKTIGVRHSYKLLKDKNIDITISEYCNICNDFSKFIMNKVFEGYSVKLPSNFGVIEIQGKKIKPTIDKITGDIKGCAVNWKETYKLWNDNPILKQKKEKIYFLNEHTRSIRYKFHWFKKNVFATYKILYNLRLSRFNKRHLAQLINNGKEYLIIN